MQIVKSIILLNILGILIFPWQIFCINHPFGHKHHHHDGPSPCELRKEYNGIDLVIWPPMSCKHITAEIDQFQESKIIKVKSLAQNLFCGYYNIQLDPVLRFIQGFNPLPESKSNSDPPLSINRLRGPPLLFS